MDSYHISFFPLRKKKSMFDGKLKDELKRSGNTGLTYLLDADTDHVINMGFDWSKIRNALKRSYFE